MRGDTDPQETLGAQQLKTQNGSMRVRDKQNELVRLARDLVEITSEIATEKFSPAILIEMSQTQLPTAAMVQRQVAQIQQQLAQQSQQIQQQMRSQQDPSQGQQLMQAVQAAMMQGQQQIQKLQAQPTIHQVLDFLKNNRAKSFVLDIETDSTIMADENGEKQRRTEFVGVLGQLLPQLAQMIGADPSTAPFCGELLKFATAPFRAGRALDGAIDELVEQMKTKADQQQGDDPTTAQNKTALQIEQMKDRTAQIKINADTQIAQQKLQQDDLHNQQNLMNQRTIKQMEIDANLRVAKGEATIDLMGSAQKGQQEAQAHQAEMAKAAAELQNTQQKGVLAQQSADAKRADMAARQTERQQQATLRAQQPKPRGPV
jgi:hypothetical protein